MRPYWFTLTVSFVLVCVSSFFAIVLLLISSILVIDHILQREVNVIVPDFGLINLTEGLAHSTGFSQLFVACVLYAVAQLVWAVAVHYHRVTLTHAVVNGLRDLRRDLFQHLETRPASFYDNVAVGRVMTRVTNDIEALYELLRGLGSLIGEFLPFCFALVVMLRINLEMSLVLLVYLPLLAVITVIFRRYTRRLFRLVRQSVSALNQNLQENLNGLQVVQISGREDFNYRRYQRINANNLGFETRSMRHETIYTSFNENIASMAIGVILWFAGGKVLQEVITLGGLILFTRFIDMLFHPIVVLGEQINILFRAMASGERIFQALDWDESLHEPENPVTLPERLKGQIEFRNLEFAYREEPVLKGVSLTIQPGENLAIVGTTGSGKSTLIRLLNRFYDVPDGCIFLDGIDINDIRSKDLRQRIGVVLQDFHIFSGSIHDNITLGDSSLTRATVIAASQYVNADQFIEALPDGYDTQLSERGQNLSQGQRQLLAFARVLAANPEILVLDEATANIDTESELLIQDAMEVLTTTRTSIIIAHRLQTIQNSDRVLVLDHGRIAELGTHDELLQAKGIYHTLHNFQFRQDSIDSDSR
ncbi:MAG: ABC transporter ATP-binding protein [Gammaproteobacteria bacterium]|nr:ABC transporter ATP-binding protein [Gammaproteobacteria bacterium]MYF38538.1 ABC transporter ATP-binding protein [Gammaproteobacteria bacterium]